MALLEHGAEALVELLQRVFLPVLAGVIIFCLGYDHPAILRNGLQAVCIIQSGQFQ